jgi:uncharacterized protein
MMLDRQTGPDNPAAAAQRESRLFALLVLFGIYFCLNLILRWLRWSLLVGQAKNGWPEPTLGTIVYQIYMACLPVLFYGWLLYVLSLRFPRLLNRLVVAVALVAVVVVVELDMDWFTMSRTHLTFDDAWIFLTGNPDDFGLEPEELLRHFKRLVGHAAFMGMLGVLSLLLAKLLVRWDVLARLRLTRQKAGLVLGLLVLADSAWVGYCTRHDTGLYNPSQWRFVAYANPVRATWLDRCWSAGFAAQPDLQLANQVLAEASPRAGAAPEARPAARASRPPCNVMVLAVESFNARIVAETDLPFWKELSQRSVQLERHYSTGNCTQYGLLGLLYGTPPYFYDGALGQGASPCLDSFNKQGYRSRRISSPLSAFRNLGAYLGKFTEPEFEARDVWDLIPAVRASLTEPGPHFHFLFYGKTHYPYGHAPQFNRFQPEVPEDFHFQRGDAIRYREPITNRYKNAVLEFDTWLAALAKEIDLDNTILVVTGDHGEEFFETGRLGHCSFLNDAQTRVPCLLSIPGQKTERLSYVTSHADIMPTLLELVGGSPAICYGQPIFEAGGARSAVVAQNNHHHRPTTWAVVSEEHKTIVEGRHDLRIIALFDKSDREIRYSDEPPVWASNFEAVKRFGEALAE